MEDLRPDALQTVAARVAAWHNRHPLARRIVAEQVQSVGFVALPYLPAAGQAAKPANQTGKPGPSQEASGEAGLSLRERAQARQAAGSTRAAAPAGEAAAPPVGPKPKLKAAFSEDFIAGGAYLPIAATLNTTLPSARTSSPGCPRVGWRAGPCVMVCRWRKLHGVRRCARWWRIR